MLLPRNNKTIKSCYLLSRALPPIIIFLKTTCTHITRGAVLVCPNSRKCLQSLEMERRARFSYFLFEPLQARNNERSSRSIDLKEPVPEENISVPCSLLRNKIFSSLVFLLVKPLVFKGHPHSGDTKFVPGKMFTQSLYLLPLLREQFYSGDILALKK